MNIKNAEFLKEIEKNYKSGDLVREMKDRISRIYKSEKIQQSKEKSNISDCLYTLILTESLFDRYDNSIHGNKQKISCINLVKIPTDKLLDYICDHYEVISQSKNIDSNLAKEFKNNSERLNKLKFYLQNNMSKFGLNRNFFINEK